MVQANSDIETFRELCRTMELKRQQFFKDDWEKNIKLLSRSQYFHLMVVRSFLPCNLNTIVSATGLTSAGASIYVDNLVQLNIFKRELATHDRRHIIISLTPTGEAELKKIDERLNTYIDGFFANCTLEEKKMIHDGVTVLRKKLNA